MAPLVGDGVSHIASIDAVVLSPIESFGMFGTEKKSVFTVQRTSSDVIKYVANFLFCYD